MGFNEQKLSPKNCFKRSNKIQDHKKRCKKKIVAIRISAIANSNLAIALIFFLKKRKTIVAAKYIMEASSESRTFASTNNLPTLGRLYLLTTFKGFYQLGKVTPITNFQGVKETPITTFKGFTNSEK